MKPNDKAIEAARAAILKAMAERNCIIAGVPFNENNYDEFDAGEAVEHAKVALDAAYAAQFPPSEDYAGLVERLKHKVFYRDDWLEPMGAIPVQVNKDMSNDEGVYSQFYNPDGPEAADAIETLLAKLNSKPKPSEEYAELVAKLKDDYGFNATSDDCIAAADALEAVLAERAAWKGRQEATAAILKQVETERDALLARLAPVDDETLVEIVAKRMCVNDDDFNDEEFVWRYTAKSTKEYYLRQARNAIAAVRPLIEAAERERCAKIAETPELWVTDKPSRGCDDIAAATRSRGSE